MCKSKVEVSFYIVELNQSIKKLEFSVRVSVNEEINVVVRVGKTIG